MIAIVVQARMGSTRCPGKVTADIAGEPMLARMLERLAFVAEVQGGTAKLVLATTTDPTDAPLVEIAERAGIASYRGHPTDLLDRHLRAAQSLGAGVTAVAKIPSDCPLVDPRIVDAVLVAFRERQGAIDYVGNLHPATWPDGNDVEVMSMDALSIAHREAKRSHEREHTTPFLWDQPERFCCHAVLWPGGRDLSMTHRFTVDYPEDVAFVRAVMTPLLALHGPNFSLDDVLALLRRRPHLMSINAAYAGVNWYREHLTDLRTVDAKETRWPQNH